MNEKYAVFIWASFGLTWAVLLWNWFAPRMARNDLRRRMSESRLDEGEVEQ